MSKKAFVTKEMVEEIVKTYPTPFHIYDEKGIRENAKALKEAFSWNKGYKEFFAVKATPNPFLIDILREYGCGTDCSSMTELMLSNAMGVKEKILCFLPMIRRQKNLFMQIKSVLLLIWMTLPILTFGKNHWSLAQDIKLQI